MRALLRDLNDLHRQIQEALEFIDDFEVARGTRERLFPIVPAAIPLGLAVARSVADQCS